MGDFLGQSGRYGHGTPDSVPGDRDVYVNFGAIGRFCPTVRKTENKWDKLHAQETPSDVLTCIMTHQYSYLP